MEQSGTSDRLAHERRGMGQLLHRIQPIRAGSLVMGSGEKLSYSDQFVEIVPSEVA